MSVMGLFQVFLVVSIIQVNFCYPDVSKRKYLSRSSRSEIISSLESIIDSPSENPQTDVIKSLEDFVEIKPNSVSKRSDTQKRRRPLLRQLLNQNGQLVGKTTVFQENGKNSKSSSINKYFNFNSLRVFQEKDNSATLKNLQNKSGSIKSSATQSSNIVAPSQNSHFANEPLGPNALQESYVREDVNKNDRKAIYKAKYINKRAIQVSSFKTNEEATDSTENGKATQESAQGSASDDGLDDLMDRASGISGSASGMPFNHDGAQTVYKKDEINSEESVYSQASGRSELEGNRTSLMERSRAEISGEESGSSQESGVSGLEEQTNAPLTSDEVNDPNENSQSASGEESGLVTETGGANTKKDSNASEDNHNTPLSLDMNLESIQQIANEDQNDVSGGSGSASAMSSGEASGEDMLKYSPRTKKEKDNLESGVSKQTITEDLVINANNMDAINNDNDINNIIVNNDISLLDDQNSSDNSNNNTDKLVDSDNKDFDNSNYQNIINMANNITNSNNNNGKVDNINISDDINEDNPDVSSGDTIGSGNDDETAAGNKQPYSDLNVLRKTPGPDVHIDDNTDAANEPSANQSIVASNKQSYSDLNVLRKHPGPVVNVVNDNTNAANEPSTNQSIVANNQQDVSWKTPGPDVHIDDNTGAANEPTTDQSMPQVGNIKIDEEITPDIHLEENESSDKTDEDLMTLNNAKENTTAPEEHQPSMSIRIDFNRLKTNLESAINDTIATANSMDLKDSKANSQSIKTQTSTNKEAPTVDKANTQKGELTNSAINETNANLLNPKESKTNSQGNDAAINKITSTFDKATTQKGELTNKTKNKSETTMNETSATSNILSPKESNTKLQGNDAAINKIQTTHNNEDILKEAPKGDNNTLQGTQTQKIQSNKPNAALEQEKKLIALSTKTDQNSIPYNLTLQAMELNKPKGTKAIKVDYDIEKEKERIAASVRFAEQQQQQQKKPVKVANAAELHDHAKATFHIGYFGRKGEKVIKKYGEDKLASLLDTLKFGKEPSVVNRTVEFTNIKQCGLFVEDYNVSKVGESWNRGILSQYPYLYEMPKHFSKCSTTTWFNHTDMRGSVFLSFQVRSILGDTMMNNARVCAKYCCREPRCRAWTLRIQEGETRNCDKGAYCCWLKSAVPEVQSGAENSTSGIVDRVHTKHPPAGMRSAVPLGGITTGSFELHADGTFHEWTIENQSPGGSAKLNKGALDMAVLGVRVSSRSSSEAALLRTYPPQGFPGVETLSYSGAYPVSKLTPGGKITEQIKMDLFAFPSFHPRNPYDSAVPAVTFTLNLENKDSFEPANVSFMLNLPLGYQEDTIRTGDNYGEAVFTRNILPSECARACAKMPKCMAWTTNGPTACLLKDKMPLHSWQSGIISGLKGMWSVDGTMLTMERPGFFPQSGSTTLYAVEGEGEIASFAASDDFWETWQQFAKSGLVGNFTSSTSMALHGSASIQTTLQPGQKKSLSIIMAWYYPNRDHAQVSIGNFYSNLFSSSQAVALHMHKNLIQTVGYIINWQVPFLLPNSFIQEPHHVNKLPLWLNDLLMNSVSYWRSSFWTKDGRWRQWEAYDCNDIDTIHSDMRRILPYMIFYPEVVRHLLLSWAANQYSNGMMQEALTEGCLGKTGKLDYAGGRVMADSTSMFVVGVYHYYKWTGHKDVLDKLWPACKKAITWLIVDSTHGTGLPLRKTSYYSITGIDKYDHHIYDSVIYLLALRASRDLATHLKDDDMEKTISTALDRAQTLVEKEFWNEHNRYYRAWWDIEYGAADWLMSDSFYGQVWAYTLGLGDLVPRKKLRQHLYMEAEINDTPWGLRVIDDKRPPKNEEDTSLVLSYKYPGCESLENVSKHKSIWMGADADWSSLMIHLETDPRKALKQAKKPLDHWRSTLNDQWNIHEQISSGGYGQDGLPWANSHANAHLTMWHIPLAVSGQQYSAIEGSLTFWPMLVVPFQLPFFTPTASGLIGGTMVNGNDLFPEEMFTFQVTSGEVRLKVLKIFDTPYGQGEIHLAAGSKVSWSKPRANVRNILSELKNK